MIKQRTKCGIRATLLWFALACPATAQWGIVSRNVLELDTSAIGSVAELSGVTYLGPSAPGVDRFAAVQDNGAGVTVFDVAISSDASLVSATGVSQIALEDGFDFEGVAYSNPARNSLFVSYEGDPATPSTLPGVREYDLATGDLLQSIALPDPWNTSGITRGNRGFESLSRSPSGRTMWTGNEEALTIDGPAATQASGTTVRLQKLDVVGNTIAAAQQYAYQVEPIHGPTNSSARSGLADLVSLPDGSLLTLERSAALTLPPIQARIYQLGFQGATDISQQPFVDGLSGTTFDAAQKTLLFSGGVGGLFEINNLEGLALGPRLPSGNWSLVGVVDNGGGSTGNLIVSFELTPPSCDLTGDYDCSGGIDKFDYATWQETFGSTTLNFADGNGDMIVSAADYTVWRDNLANANLVASSTIPEPSTATILMGLLGNTLLLGSQRTNRS